MHTLNTAAAAAVHQQLQQALPAGYRLETGGGPCRLSASVYDEADALRAFHCGAPAAVLADTLTDLLAFPATDAFPRR